MLDHLLNDGQRCVRDDAREFVNSTRRQLVLDMDEEKIRFPREWLREAGRRNLLGVRHPVKWGGRGMDWVTAGAVAEEVGSLRLASIWTGTNEIMASIIAHELCREAAARKDGRDYGADAAAEATDEIIFE